MLGHQVGRGLLRASFHTRLPLRPCQSQRQYDLAARVFVLCAYRLYATPGRPRKAVGEPSRPVKRAVTRAAKAPTSASDAAKQDNEAKKPKARTAKAAKKSAKPTAKKAAPKKRAKRPLTEQGKIRKDKMEARAKTKELKKAALDPPQNTTSSAFREFTVAQTKGTSRGGQELTDIMKTVGQEWKQLSPAEHEHYNHLAATTNTARRAAYKSWVESHTPAEIDNANRARAQLRRSRPSAVKHAGRYAEIRDERRVKHPKNAFLHFSLHRYASGDFHKIALGDAGKLIAKEWASLSEGEKKKYIDLGASDRTRYHEEVRDVYGRDSMATSVQKKSNSTRRTRNSSPDNSSNSSSSNSGEDNTNTYTGAGLQQEAASQAAAASA